jgi:hypothetical protein
MLKTKRRFVTTKRRFKILKSHLCVTMWDFILPNPASPFRRMPFSAARHFFALRRRLNNKESLTL